MSRELLIVRHAHAEPASAATGDFDRPLSAHGKAETGPVAAHLRGRGLHFARVLCSPAKRTRETLAAVWPEAAAVEFNAEVYEATPGTLLRLLDAPGGAWPVLLVGHNPGLEQLVALLADGHSDAARGLPPAAVVHLRIAADRELEPAAAEVLDFWSP